ncbi:2Fe-2S ferredoxin [Novimethylophilus kurashikiensis]|uniref:2Fe-2S ferredoxin n=1 Tax=Novimethylophilus kurashikiensis TaxID=1825523 RepID=A0A2R5F9M5_9PROT|nr:2Fe-2S ferredoxin [Novimethylophilus kurashikiensis]
MNRRANPDMPSCGHRGGMDIADTLESALALTRGDVQVQRFNCLGCCDLGPNLRLSPGGEFWHHVRVDDVPRLVKRLAEFDQET